MVIEVMIRKSCIEILWANTLFGKHFKVRNSRLTLSLKRKVCNQCVLRVMAKGAKTWKPTEHLERVSTSHGGKNDRSNAQGRKQDPWLKERTRLEDKRAQIERKV